MVKFVGRKAVVEGNEWDLGFVVGGGGKDRSFRNSRGRARRIVNDLTTNRPPNRRPFTSEAGLKEKSEDGFVVWSLECWCFCFLFLFFFSFSPPILVAVERVFRLLCVGLIRKQRAVRGSFSVWVCSVAGNSMILRFGCSVR